MNFSSFSTRRKVTLVAIIVGIVLVLAFLMASIFPGKGTENPLPPAPSLPQLPENPPAPETNDVTPPPPPAFPVN